MKNILILLTAVFCPIQLCRSNNISIDPKELAGQLKESQSVRFIENKGQLSDINHYPVPFVLFKTSSPGIDVYITEKGLTYVFFKSEKEQKEKGAGDQYMEEKRKTEMTWINVHLSGASIKKENIIKEGESNEYFNYFPGHCPDGIYGVKEYEKITIKEVYPGIDWVLYANSKTGMKYDFVVHHKGDASSVKLIYESENSLKMDEEGNLHLHTPLGDLTEKAPYCYMKESREEIFSKYSLRKIDRHHTEVSFKLLSALDKELEPDSKTLIIDPQLVWATLYGGNNLDGPMCVAIDSSGNMFVTGYTGSTNFPLQNAGTYYQNYTSMSGTFISKFTNAGFPLWVTHYEGFAESIALDSKGNVFVTGITNSNNFPLQNAGTFFQDTIGGGEWDAFILKFDNTGNRLWASYYGGGGYDRGVSIKTDHKDNVFVTGWTSSVNFPVQDAGTFFQSNYAGGHYIWGGDAFILKFDNAGNRLWATYYGGNGKENGKAIATDLNGNLFITGFTTSINFPIQNAGTFFQNNYNGTGNSFDWGDAFILKFDSAGNRLWATYYGGVDDDMGQSIVVDGSGNVFVTGVTSSANFPVYDAGTFFQGALSGTFSDAFILKFDNSGNRLWATYYGGSFFEELSSTNTFSNLAIDACDNVYMSFSTGSSDIRTQPACDNGYFDGTLNGSGDQFITRFSNIGELLWATYLGGNEFDIRSALALDKVGNLFMVGEWGGDDSSSVVNTTYPFADPGSGTYFDNTYNGSDDGFIVKFNVIPLTITAEVNADCGCNSSATVNSNVSCPLLYSWSDGQTTQTATGLCAGIYMVTVSDVNTCRTVTAFVTIVPEPNEDASFSYSQSTFCQSGIANPLPVVTGLAGGTFTSTAGLILDATNGEIDLAASALGTYIVTYTTNGPCPDSSTFTVTITLAPDASFSYNEPYCHNEPNPFPAFLPGASAGNFSATPAGLIFISTITGQINLDESTPGTYTVTNSIPASGTCPASTANAPVTINPSPVLIITHPDPLCAPLTTDLKAAEVTAGSSGGNSLSYWTDASATNALDAPEEVNVSGTYYVKSTVTATGCFDIKPVEVIINHVPSSTFTVPSSLCVGTKATVIYTGNAAADDTYIWNFDGGTVVGGSGRGPYIVNWVSPGTKSITLTVTEEGCISELTTRTVTVNPADDASFSYSQNAFCQSGASPSPAITGLTGGTFASTTGLSVNPATGLIDLAASKPGNYTIRYSTKGDCPVTSTFNITITLAPNASFSYNGPYCNNGTSVPSPAFPVGAIAGTFSVTPPGLVFLNASTGKINLAASNPGTYTLTNSIPASGGCPAVSYDATITINQAPLLSVNSDSICAGQSSILIAGAQGGKPPYIFSWNPGAMGGDSISLSPSLTTTYTVTVNDANNCHSSPQTASINVFPKPIANFEMLPPLSAPLSNPLILFRDLSTETTQWLWNFGDFANSISTSKDPAFTYSDTGNYIITLIVTSNDGCTDTAYQKIYIESDEYALLYIPNAFSPDNDGLNDLFGPKVSGLEIIKSFEMFIYNRWGEEIYRTNDISKPWNGRVKNSNEESKDEKIAEQDIYVYKILVKNDKEQIQYHVGNVTLIK